MVIKVKKRNGRIVTYPATKIRNILKKVGFTGVLLAKATANTVKASAKLASRGVITATNFEKAVVKAVRGVNDLAVNTTQKVAKKVLH